MHNLRVLSVVGGIILATGTQLPARAAVKVIPPGTTTSQQQVQVLSNSDVIEMVTEHLAPSIIISKIKHSATAFDVSTTGLVHLQKAGVPQEVIGAMIERPAGTAPLEPTQDTDRNQPAGLVSKSLAEVRTIFVRAPTEVLRANAEETIGREGGPAVNPSGVGYDALLIVGVDCGPQRFSAWTFAHYATCEGSLTLQSGGQRLWSTTDHERSANTAKSGKKMVDRMTEEFVKAWKAGGRS